LQTSRTSNTNVASGQNSVISGGDTNTASSNYSTVSGGQNNTASSGSHATVVGGNSNTSSGQYSVSGGNGSVASGPNSFSFGTSSGGNANSATGGGSVAMGNGNRALATGAVAMGTQSYVIGIDSIGIGRQARAEGDFSVAFSKNNATSDYSTVSGGESNVASTNTHATVVGGKGNTSSGQYSVSGGFYSNSYLYGQNTHTSGRFSATGDAQQSSLVARKEDTLNSAATTVLSLDGTGTTNLIIPDGNNRAWNVTIKYTSIVTGITGVATGVNIGDMKAQTLTIGFKKIGGVSSVVGTISVISTHEDTSMGSAALGVSAGASQEMALTYTAPTFTGGGSLDIRTVAKVELTEVAY